MTATVSSRRQHTRDRLIDAATQLITEKSVEGASVEEISERAGFTRGAFYSNFDSKEELCLEILRRRGDQLLDVMNRALAAVPDPGLTPNSLDELLAMVLAVLDAGSDVDDDWLLVRAELRLYAYRNPSFRPAMIEVERSTSSLARTALAESLRTRQVRLRVPIDDFVTVTDAYCERIQQETALLGSEGDRNAWRTGLERVVRALVELPRSETMDAPADQ